MTALVSTRDEARRPDRSHALSLPHAPFAAPDDGADGAAALAGADGADGAGGAGGAGVVDGPPALSGVPFRPAEFRRANREGGLSVDAAPESLASSSNTSRSSAGLLIEPAML